MAEAMKKMWVMRHTHDRGERRWDEFFSRLLPVLCLKLLKGHIIFKRIHFLSHILLFPTAATPLSSQLQANHSLITTSKIPAYFLQFSNSSNLPHYPWILQLMFFTPFVSNLSFPCIVLWSITEIKNLVTPSTSPLFLLRSLIWQNWRVVKYNSNYPCEWMWLEKIHKMLMMTTDKK